MGLNALNQKRKDSLNIGGRNRQNDRPSNGDSKVILLGLFVDSQKFLADVEGYRDAFFSHHA